MKRQGLIEETMEPVRIIEYDPSYADGIAEMWNLSGDCWGGYNVELSGDLIIRQENDSDHLDVFLALIGEKVVGYCSLSEFREDTGALYIDLLNVLPEYQGRKIGKALVLKCVERTLERNWARVDLYTWPGNTKAVPLYKKCGFFWEDNDKYTHLMNFIPTVLKTELLEEYFRNVDWYLDNKRPIEITPDGIMKGKFQSYRYIWDKNGNRAEVDICRHSRMIQRIETNQFEIKASIADFDLVFGQSYSIDYEIVNKTGNLLEVAIEGENNGNIKFVYRKEFTVKDSKHVRAEFFVGEISGEQVESKTHPAVAASVRINGKVARIGIGINPQYPLEIKLELPDLSLIPTGKSLPLFLNVKNNLGKTAEFRFSLPEFDWIDFNCREHRIKLGPGQKEAYELEFVLNRAAVLAYDLVIAVTDVQGKSFNFSKEISAVFPTYNEPVWGETSRCYYLGYDRYLIKTDRKEYLNDGSFKNLEKSTGFSFSAPKLGKPFSTEFSRREADIAEFGNDSGSVTMKLAYSSEVIKDCSFTLYLKLNHTGIMETWEEIHNRSGADTLNDIFLQRAFNFPRSSIVLPYRDRIVELREEQKFNVDNFDNGKLTGNWIHACAEKTKLALIWSNQDRIKFNDWQFIIEHNTGKIGPEKTYTGDRFLFALDRFETWQEVQSFASGRQNSSTLPVEALEILLNGGNPFCRGDIYISLSELRNRKVTGKVDLNWDNDSYTEVSKQLADSEKGKLEIRLKPVSAAEIDHLTIGINFDPHVLTRQRVIFPVTENNILTKKFRKAAGESLEVSNGVLTMKAAPWFSNGIYSLSYKGDEWLESSFPKRTTKAWWNDWAGGFMAKPNRMQFKTVFSEHCDAEFVSCRDNFGCEWTGLKTSVKIQVKKEWKDLKWHSYFLFRPGVPILAYFYEISQEMGKYLPDFKLETCCFVKSATQLSNSFFLIRNEYDQEARIRAGIEEIWLMGHQTYVFGGDGREKYLQVLVPQNIWNSEISTDRDIISFWHETRSGLKPGETVVSNPGFMILTDRFNRVDELKDLYNIIFSGIFRRE